MDTLRRSSRSGKELEAVPVPSSQNMSVAHSSTLSEASFASSTTKIGPMSQYRLNAKAVPQKLYATQAYSTSKNKRVSFVAPNTLTKPESAAEFQKAIEHLQYKNPLIPTFKSKKDAEYFSQKNGDFGEVYEIDTTRMANGILYENPLNPSQLLFVNHISSAFVTNQTPRVHLSRFIEIPELPEFDQMVVKSGIKRLLNHDGKFENSRKRFRSRTISGGEGDESEEGEDEFGLNDLNYIDKAKKGNSGVPKKAATKRKPRVKIARELVKKDTPKKAASKKAASKKAASKKAASKKATPKKMTSKKATPKKATPNSKISTKDVQKQALSEEVVVEDPEGAVEGNIPEVGQE